MTIEEIKSVSIIHYLEATNRKHSYIRKGIYFYLSPYRSERNPSFAVNAKDNFWYDYATCEGGNIINLFQKEHPTYTNHEVLIELQRIIQDNNLQFHIDYVGRDREQQEKEKWKQSCQDRGQDSNTVIDGIYELSHPNLRNYITSRRVDFDVAKKYCKQVHYSVYGKSYYAISFANIEGGMEVRNKFSKRTIGRKSISIVKPDSENNTECCIFEGFFNMLTYETIRKWDMDIGLCLEAKCDYYILNSIGNIKIALPFLSGYKVIHCYLDNDSSGKATTNKILNAYPTTSVDESYRYEEYNDINDVICGITIKSYQ